MLYSMKYSGPLGFPRLTGRGPLTVEQENKDFDKAFAKFLIKQYGTDIGVSSEAMDAAIRMINEMPRDSKSAMTSEARVAGAALYGGSGFTGENISLDDISDISGVHEDDIAKSWLFLKEDALGLTSEVIVVLPTSGQDIQTPSEDLFLEVMTGSKDNMSIGVIDKDRVEFIESRTLDVSKVPNNVNLDRSRVGSTIDVLVVGIEPELEPNEAPQLKVRMSQRLNQSTFYTSKITDVEAASV